MDTRSGEIYTPEQIEQMRKVLDSDPDSLVKQALRSKLKNLKIMHLNPSAVQMARRPPKVGRNEPCPCGSGKKFKKCCLK